MTGRDRVARRFQIRTVAGDYTAEEIAGQLGCSRQVVYADLRLMGLSAKRPARPMEPEIPDALVLPDVSTPRRIAYLLLVGYTSKTAIARKLGVHVRQVHRVVGTRWFQALRASEGGWFRAHAEALIGDKIGA